MAEISRRLLHGNVARDADRQQERASDGHEVNTEKIAAGDIRKCRPSLSQHWGEKTAPLNISVPSFNEREINKTTFTTDINNNNSEGQPREPPTDAT